MQQTDPGQRNYHPDIHYQNYGHHGLFPVIILKIGLAELSRHWPLLFLLTPDWPTILVFEATAVAWPGCTNMYQVIQNQPLLGFVWI